MMNQFFLVGRLTKNFVIEEKDNKKYAHNTIAVVKPFKNEEGIYETDFFDFTTFGPIATSCAEYCKKGDLIGIKGSLSTFDNKICLHTERVSFLSSKSKKDDIEEEKDIKM